MALTEQKFQQVGTGAVNRDVSDKLKEVVSVKDFGAVGNGVADDTAAIQAAIDYVGPLTSGQVWFPAGQYVISSTLRIKNSGVELVGAGQNSVRLIRNTDYGDTIYVAATDPVTTRLSNITISGFSIYMNAEMNSGAHIKVSDTIHCTIENVLLWDGFISMDFEGIQNSSVINTDIKTGAYYSSTKSGSCFVRIKTANNPANETGELSFTDFNWTRTGAIDTPIEFGLRIEAGDGIWFSNGHIFGSTTTCRIIPQTATTQLQGLYFNQVWFDQKTEKHVSISGDSTAGFGNFGFTGCKGLNASVVSFEITSGATNLSGVYVEGGVWSITTAADYVFDIQNGKHVRFKNVEALSTQAMKATAIGYNIGSAPRRVAITGGSVGTTVTASPLATGVAIGSTAQEIQVSATTFHGCTNEISFVGPLRDGSKITGCITTRNRDTMCKIPSAPVLNVPALIHTVDIETTSGNITDISPCWDGRQLVIRSNGVTTTFKHNTGTTGTTLRCSGAADIVITSGQYATATYHDRSGAWFIQK